MPTTSLPAIHQGIPLAGLTTLGAGGPARYLARCTSQAELLAALAWAREHRLATFVLGGGSNLLVADAGFDGLVLQLASRTMELEPMDELVRVRAGAGLGWDTLVARTVAEGLAGLECLSGIPGRVGAAPIQNVGAYGQEVSDSLEAVHVVDRSSGQAETLAAAQCGLGYRSSHFKLRWPERYVITGVDFLLPRRPQGSVRYPELRRHLGLPADPTGHLDPPLAEVRQAVLEVRRGKSMVLRPGDENRRSAGSFFVNPVVPPVQAERIHHLAEELGDRPMPAFPAPGGQVKLSAAWLIEAAGFPRGYQLGAAGISSRHTLALINHGGATAADLIALARLIRQRVAERFGVTLEPEPCLLGYPGGWKAALAEPGPL